jgi:RNA 2',3'-cyclic 3'-phosphodiesterase
VRAFLAVPVGGGEALPRLGEWLGRLEAIRGLRPVPRHQLHFTLKFFEELPADRVAAAKQAAARAAVSAPPFSLELAGLGVFPPRGPARVLWVGCGAGARELTALAEAVEREFARAGFAPEPRPFSPHLTLARAKDPKPGRAAAELAASNAVAGVGAFPVRELVLFASVLGPAGAAHTPLARIPLGPTDPGLAVG